MLIYENLAEIYDIINADVPYEQESYLLKKLLDDCKGKKLLDVCCGTGQHLRFLNGKQYTLAGVDYAQDMINIARTKKIKAEFYVDDMRSFTLNEKFDVVSCLGSALQYNLTINYLKKSIQNLIAHSSKYVIFDMRYCIDKWIDAYVKDVFHKSQRYVIHESWISKRQDFFSIWEPKYEITDKITGEKLQFVDFHKIYLFSVNQVCEILKEEKINFKIIDINAGQVKANEIRQKHFYFLIEI